MTIRIASFNVENLFERARVMNLENWDAGRQTLADYARLNTLIKEPIYTDAVKQEMLEIIDRLGLSRSDETPLVILQQIRGRLLRRPQQGPPEIAASGRADWIGWIQLKTGPVNEIAIEMTGRVIQDVHADILAVVEAENRVALTRFNEQLLKPANAAYNSIMLIDGNDDRGIDVGLLTKPNYAIETVVSHIDDLQNGSRLFSRDCPEYQVRVSPDTTILFLINHLKSKGYGSPAQSNARRKAQATRVREIYELRRSQGVELIAIVGDFNDTPDSRPLEPLLAQGSELRDISTHPGFQSDGRPGTYGNGNKSDKFDYVLCSPALFARVVSGGVWRMGVWGGKHGNLFPHYDRMTSAVHAASDHAAIWADLDI